METNASTLRAPTVCRKRRCLRLLLLLSVFAFLLFWSVSGRAAETFLPGDLDSDGSVTAGDARVSLRMAVGLDAPESETVRLRADMDHDGDLTAADARLVLRCAVGLEDLNRFHRFEESETVPASEAGQGYAIYTCTVCGYAERRTITDPAHIHTFTETGREEATCGAPGKIFLVCTGCGVTVETVIPATGEHRFVLTDVINGNNKTERHHICAVCGLDTDPTPALPDESLQAKLAAIFTEYGAVGAQAAVIKDGQVTAAYAWGTAEKTPLRAVNTDTKYRAASLSKLVTFLVFMALQDRGLVDENADISDYFGYRCRNPYYPNIVITPSMLMAHTASIGAVEDYILGDGDLADKRFYLDLKPGTAYEYSNTGCCLVACICERATGRYLNDLAKEYLFEPLGIDASFVASELQDQSNIGVLYGEDGGKSLSAQLATLSMPLGTSLKIAQGNLTVSAKDYAKIVAMLINNGKNSAGETVLSENAIKAIRQERISTELYGVAYGSQIETTVIEGKTVYVHTGSAWGMFSTYMYSVEDRCGVVVLTSGCERSLDPESEVYHVCLDAIRAVYPE